MVLKDESNWRSVDRFFCETQNTQGILYADKKEKNKYQRDKQISLINNKYSMLI